MKAASLDDLRDAMRGAVDDAIAARLTEHVLETAAADAALRDALAPICLAAHERKILATMALGEATPADLDGLTVGAFASRVRGEIFARLRSGTDLLSLRAAFPGVQGAALAREVAAIEESPVVVGPPLRRLVLEVIAADAFSMFVADLRTLYQLTKVEAASHDERRHVGALDGASLRARLRGLSCALAPALRALEDA
jgi:glycosyltransferase A (GT-A) superfamily protein (DUF2064 family)